MFKKIIFPDGLRLLLIPDSSTQAVAVLVLVATGSKYETKKTNGLSHFLEHMLFKGTKKRPTPLKVKEVIDRVGGVYNAFTSKEYTGYWVKVRKRDVALALDWVADIFLNSKIPELEIEKEKGVIIEEINMYLDTPSSYVLDLWEEVLYGDQPAGWLTIGRKENILSFRRKDFLNYLVGHYTAKNTVVAVAGNFNEKEVLSYTKTLFKKISQKNPPGKPPVKESQTRPQLKIHFKETDQSHLCLGVRGFDLFHPQKYALLLLGVILGGNMSSRLFEKIREKMGAAYYISTFSEFYTDSGYLVTHCGVPHEKLEKVIKAILKEYQRIKEKGVSKSELRKAKDYYKGTATLSFESTDAKASFFAFQELLENKLLTLEQKFELVERVTVQDIRLVASKIFQNKKLNLALIGPHKSDKVLKTITRI